MKKRYRIRLREDSYYVIERHRWPCYWEYVSIQATLDEAKTIVRRLVAPPDLHVVYDTAEEDAKAKRDAKQAAEQAEQERHEAAVRARVRGIVVPK